MDYKEIYEDWCKNPLFDEETKAELMSIRDNEEEIKDRFYKNLEFGTGGLRGVIGNSRTCQLHHGTREKPKRSSD